MLNIYFSTKIADMQKKIEKCGKENEVTEPKNASSKRNAPVG